MTKQEKTNLGIAVLTALPIGGAIAFWLIATAFVPHKTYDADQKIVNQRIDTLAVRQQRESDKQDRILCYLQSQANERPVSECVR